jgi:hypothetical protein
MELGLEFEVLRDKSILIINTFACFSFVQTNDIFFFASAASRFFLIACQSNEILKIISILNVTNIRYGIRVGRKLLDEVGYQY